MKLTLPLPVQNVVGILNWKLGPEVLPKSPALLAVSLTAFTVAVFLRQLMDYSALRALASGIGSAAVLAAVAFLCATVSGYRDRLTQTLSALALGGAIVIFMTVVLRFLLIVSLFGTLAGSNNAQEGSLDTMVIEVANFALFPLFVWNVFVFAALFRRSFRPNVIVAFAIAIPLVFIVDFWVPVAFRSL
jgi:hypothetical protein